MKKEGFTVRGNKYIIEYPLCYVQIKLMFPRGLAELVYNISVKEIHGELTKEETNNFWGKYDFIAIPKLNNEYGLYSDCHFDLIKLNSEKLESFIQNQLEKYIKPFGTNMIEYLKKGRLFQYYDDSVPHYIQFYMGKDICKNIFLNFV